MASFSTPRDAKIDARVPVSVTLANAPSAINALPPERTTAEAKAVLPIPSAATADGSIV